MVRINLINPRALADQHLIAEYNEILMLLGYIRKFPSIIEGEIPKKYTLGKGHIKFFKNKVLYLKKRHEILKNEMKRRGFIANISIDVDEFSKNNKKDWTPNDEDMRIIKERLIFKIQKKEGYYRYMKKNESIEFFIKKIKDAN